MRKARPWTGLTGYGVLTGRTAGKRPAGSALAGEQSKPAGHLISVQKVLGVLVAVASQVSQCQCLPSGLIG